MTQHTLWSFIANADFVVKIVILILFAASIASWTIIFQRIQLLKITQQAGDDFEEQFWSGNDLNSLFSHIDQTSRTGLSEVFHAGFSEFNRLRQQENIHPDAIIQGTQRAMRVAENRTLSTLEGHLSFLATIGSTSPYVGLFGTVWGIMSSFRALGSVQQASIAMVAPGISEALIATAVGLFAAIPAVIAYNRFTNQVEQLAQQYETFEAELTNILQREIYRQKEA